MKWATYSVGIGQYIQTPWLENEYKSTLLTSTLHGARGSLITQNLSIILNKRDLNILEGTHL